MSSDLCPLTFTPVLLYTVYKGLVKIKKNGATKSENIA
jgi:hypothetical protein